MNLMKVQYILARITLTLCVSALLLNSFNMGLAQKPQTRYEKLITASLLKRARASSQRALSFEENQGQARSDARFLVRGNQFTASLSNTAATLSLGTQNLSVLDLDSPQKTKRV